MRGHEVSCLADVGSSVINANAAHLTPADFGLAPKDAWPSWATVELTPDQARRLRELDFNIECSAGEPAFECHVSAKSQYLASQGLNRDMVARAY